MIDKDKLDNAMGCLHEDMRSTLLEAQIDITIAIGNAVKALARCIDNSYDCIRKLEEEKEDE